MLSRRGRLQGHPGVGRIRATVDNNNVIDRTLRPVPVPCFMGAATFRPPRHNFLDRTHGLHRMMRRRRVAQRIGRLGDSGVWRWLNKCFGEHGRIVSGNDK